MVSCAGLPDRHIGYPGLRRVAMAASSLPITTRCDGVTGLQARVYWPDGKIGRKQESPMAAIELEVVKSFGNLVVIEGVDLAVAHGEFIVFVGTMGCGKSSFCE